MTQTLTIDRTSTAILAMDFQNDIVDAIPACSEGVLDAAVAVLDKARAAGVTVMYVVVRFREGYPEVSARNKIFTGIKAANRLREGTPGAEIHSRVAPVAGEAIVTKRRVGAFSTTDLESLLRAKDIKNLVLLGIMTSGVVLSTVRWAADSDYSLVVVADACGDRNEDVHRMLMEKVFPAQATVVTAQEVIAALNAG